MVAVRRIPVFVLLSQFLFRCEDSSSSRPLVFYVLGEWGRRGNPGQHIIANQMNLRPTGMAKESIFSASKQGFMSVSIEKLNLTVNIVNYKGQILYNTTISK
jgi:hypothetical protein